MHTDFLFVGFSRLCNKRLGEKSVRRSGVKQGIREEEEWEEVFCKREREVSLSCEHLSTVVWVLDA